MRLMTAACLTMATLIGAQATEIDVQALFARAEQDGRVGTARKTKPVDARPAKPGEVMVTVIAGEGKETQSPPAVTGDMVVRNRCTLTGDEQILVPAAKFAERYEGPIWPTERDGWLPYRPKGVTMLFLTLGPDEGPFSFMAPWGEPMVARPGDAIVQDPEDAGDTYRIAAAAFACTYEVVEPAGAG
jgi:hypothetical protein